MSEMTRRRRTPDAVWAEARKAWEGGETARSVARRYDVGVPALWKRREAESWTRPDPASGPVEPAEGWDRFAERERDRFEAATQDARALALDLIKAMSDGPLDEAPLWHLGWLLDWRAKNLGAEVAARDREWTRNTIMGEAFWTEGGWLRPVATMDVLTWRRNRETWRRQVGLPDGAAEAFP